MDKKVVIAKKLKPETIFARARKILGAIAKLEEEYKGLCGRCSHVGSISFSHDPSGNNDSSYDCTACGSSWRRWPEGVPKD